MIDQRPSISSLIVRSNFSEVFRRPNEPPRPASPSITPAAHTPPGTEPGFDLFSRILYGIGRRQAGSRRPPHLREAMSRASSSSSSNSSLSSISPPVRALTSTRSILSKPIIADLEKTDRHELSVIDIHRQLTGRGDGLNREIPFAAGEYQHDQKAQQQFDT